MTNPPKSALGFFDLHPLKYDCFAGALYNPRYLGPHCAEQKAAGKCIQVNLGPAGLVRMTPETAAEFLAYLRKLPFERGGYRVQYQNPDTKYVRTARFSQRQMFDLREELAAVLRKKEWENEVP